MEIVHHTFTHKPYIKRNKTTMIILHCSATIEGKDYSVEQINKWHNQRGFNGIGYQYVIYRDGTIHEGRPENIVGAQCTGKNSVSIGICYIGGLDKKGNPKDTRTDEQKQSMFELCAYLLQKYELNINDVHTHNEFAKKACPCFSKETIRQELKEYIIGHEEIQLA